MGCQSEMVIFQFYSFNWEGRRFCISSIGCRVCLLYNIDISANISRYLWVICGGNIKNTFIVKRYESWSIKACKERRKRNVIFGWKCKHRIMKASLCYSLLHDGTIYQWKRSDVGTVNTKTLAKAVAGEAALAKVRKWVTAGLWALR